MKKWSTLAVCSIMMAVAVHAQNLIKEPFDFPAKDSLDGMGGWVSNKVITSKIAVVSPGLVFNGYAANGVGNAVKFPNKDNGDICSKFFQKIDSGSVYLSYLIKVDSMTAGSTSGYNVALDQSGGATNLGLKCFVQRSTDSTFYFGVSKLTGVTTLNKLYKTKQTYLVVLRYQFAAGTGNDTAKLYVFPTTVPLNEPAKADTFSVIGTDAVDFGEVYLTNSYAQSGLKNSPITIDELRVGRSWSATVHEPTSTMLTEDFYYTVGDSLRGKNGWDVYYGGAPLFVDSLSLSYTGYNGSAQGRAMRITGGAGSQSLYRPFPSIGDTTVYLSFMTNFAGTNAVQGYFVSLANLNSGNYRALVYAKIESGNLQFGLRATLSGTLQFDTTKYSTGKTYLLVVKYQYVAGDNNDEISLFVLSSGIPVTEPNRPNVGPIVMPNDAIAPASVVLNSGAFTAGGPLSGASIIVDGIRVTKQQWRSGLTAVRPVSAGSLPAAFELEQNYPNPFNPSTTFTYHLTAAGRTVMTVYDVVGREVRTLVNDVQNAGSYSVRFDGTGLASGIYFARLQSGSGVQMRKMMLLK
jgi:hypothetical protein